MNEDAAEEPPSPDDFYAVVADADRVAARLATRAFAFVYHGRSMRVRVVDDARQLLEVARARQPHLVLIDVDGTDGDPADLLAALRKLPGGDAVRVIVKTTAPAGRLGARRAELGTIDLLPKPAALVDVMRLLETIAQRDDPGRSLAATPA